LERTKAFLNHRLQPLDALLRLERITGELEVTHNLPALASSGGMTNYAAV